MTEQLNLKVKGMTCVGCEQRITTALDGVLGVEEPSADHELGRLRLLFNPGLGDGEAVRGAIKGLGSRVVA